MMPDDRQTKIRIRGLHKSFGPKVVLDGVDVDVAAGESFVVIGGSGTGKSVMLKHIIGLLRPDSGTVEVDGVAVEKLGNREITEFRRKFGMSFQEGALFDSMTIWQNVAFPLQRLTKMSRKEIDERVRECLSMVRLEGVEEKLPSQLSGGMRRRVGFARSVAHSPEILLFDEPTTGLDPVTTALIDEVIVDLNDRLKTTTVTITHDMESAFRIGDRIAMLHKGKIIASAPPKEFRTLDDPRVQQFIHGQAEGPLSDEAARRTGPSQPIPGPSEL
ncbi:MAG TPA: ATP-binding cassette domain-containing protein [Thermoanaerobaculia bacterium]|jgi:phospholipid/cholesterol/gamma-HCH transport system ATP-binding protein|nr:ATP-binding cassette domain-containing protein [Thermoanaerobaculia bacterium]